MISINTPIIPNTTVADLHGLYGILALLKDPEAFQKRLDQITQMMQQLGELRAKTATERAEVDLKRKEIEASQKEAQVSAQKTLKEAQDIATQHRKRSEDLDKRQSDMVSREGALAKAEQILGEDRKKHEIEYTQKRSELTRIAQSSKIEADQRNAALEAKETALKAAHAKAQKDAKDAEALRISLEQKHQALMKALNVQ
jgi:hypothetical protein